MKKFENYKSNLAILVSAKNEDLNNEFILSGIINKFNLQFELGWKVLKELMKYEGLAVANTGSPREIIKAAYTMYDFIDEDKWLQMLKDRNNLAHIYDGEAAKRLVRTILDIYISEFIRLEHSLNTLYGDMDCF